jgi:hypothetical protein
MVRPSNDVRMRPAHAFTGQVARRAMQRAAGCPVAGRPCRAHPAVGHCAGLVRRTMPTIRILAFCVAVALPIAAQAAEPASIFDAHLHYNAEAAGAYPVADALRTLPRVGRSDDHCDQPAQRRTLRRMARPLRRGFRYMDQRALGALRRHHRGLPRLARGTAASRRRQDRARERRAPVSATRAPLRRAPVGPRLPRQGKITAPPPDPVLFR